MLLSIAALSIIAGIGVPVYQSLQVRNDLDIAATTVAHDARRAQLLAQASDGDSPWGVSVSTAQIILFKGASYASRDSTFDELSSIPTTITSSGFTEIVFNKYTGLPQTTGTITLTSIAGNLRTITINAKGTITY